jgi:hypothetical protein
MASPKVLRSRVARVADKSRQAIENAKIKRLLNFYPTNNPQLTHLARAFILLVRSWDGDFPLLSSG